MKSLILKLQTYWSNLPPVVKSWIHGLEAAIWIAIGSSLVTVSFSDFTTKEGIAKFIGTELGLIAAGVRLYLKQSPVQKVVSSVIASETVSVGDVSSTKSVTSTTSK